MLQPLLNSYSSAYNWCLGKELYITCESNSYKVSAPDGVLQCHYVSKLASTQEEAVTKIYLVCLVADILD